MMAWYGTVLGGTINFKDDHKGWMTNDEANHRFAFLSVPGLEDDPAKVKHNAMSQLVSRCFAMAFSFRVQTS
jgi:catechol 2,3-dioxygenase